MTDAPVGTKCPLCGENNRCAEAAGDKPGLCWCVGKVFPKELLQRGVEMGFPNACICENCLTAFLKNPLPTQI
jgi:hypothetical protein